MANLYEYAVIKDAKFDADGQVTDPAAVITEPTTILADSRDQAEVLAARTIPDTEIGNLDRISILVRPFSN